MPQTIPVDQMLPTRFEPKRRFRWILSVEGLDNFLLKRCERPLLERTWYGKWKPGPMSIVMHDPIAPSGSQQVMEWVMANDRRNACLILLDPIGTAIEKWQLLDIKLMAVDFGTLDYSPAKDSEDINEVTIDWINSRRYLRGKPGSLVTIALRMLPRKVNLEY